MLELVAYSADLSSAWNAFNHVARNGHFMFDRGFMDYHADRFTDFSWVVLKDQAVVGLIPANRRGVTAYTHQGLTFGGLVTDGLRTLEVLEALDRWREVCADLGIQTLVYKPLPHIYHRRPSDDALFWLHRNAAQLARRDLSSAIRLDAPGPWSSRRKRGVKKAQAAGLTFGRSQRWGDYWPLLAGVLAERHGASPVHTLDEIQLLAARFPDQIQLYTAEVAGEIVAGTVMFCTREVAHAQYIAANAVGRDAGALDGLYAYLIELYRGRASYFDFGISNDRGSGDLNPGLVTQKDEFGASAVAYDLYQLAL